MVAAGHEDGQAVLAVHLTDQAEHEHVVQPARVQPLAGGRVIDVRQQVEAFPLLADGLVARRFSCSDLRRVEVAVEIDQVAGEQHRIGLLDLVATQSHLLEQRAQRIEAVAHLGADWRVPFHVGHIAFEHLSHALAHRGMANIHVHVGQVAQLQRTRGHVLHGVPALQAFACTGFLRRQLVGRGAGALGQVELVEVREVKRVLGGLLAQELGNHQVLRLGVRGVGQELLAGVVELDHPGKAHEAARIDALERRGLQIDLDLVDVPALQILVDLGRHRCDGCKRPPMAILDEHPRSEAADPPGLDVLRSRCTGIAIAKQRAGGRVGLGPLLLDGVKPQMAVDEDMQVGRRRGDEATCTRGRLQARLADDEDAALGLPFLEQQRRSQARIKDERRFVDRVTAITNARDAALGGLRVGSAAAEVGNGGHDSANFGARDVKGVCGHGSETSLAQGFEQCVRMQRKHLRRLFDQVLPHRVVDVRNGGTEAPLAGCRRGKDGLQCLCIGNVGVQAQPHGQQHVLIGPVVQAKTPGIVTQLMRQAVLQRRRHVIEFTGLDVVFTHGSEHGFCRVELVECQQQRLVKRQRLGARGCPVETGPLHQAR
ncbi:hypothetical protein D9M72_394580 [compost metagenome]